MRTLVALVAALVVAGCSPDPKDCTEKGDDKACHKLCDTGKPEFQFMCFTPRARQAITCLEKDTGCAEACKNWTAAGTDGPIREHYLANVGDSAKVAALDAKCGGKVP